MAAQPGKKRKGRYHPSWAGNPRICLLLRQYRALQDISQPKLAAEIGISRDVLISIESGNSCGVDAALAIMSWLFDKNRRPSSALAEPATEPAAQ